MSDPRIRSIEWGWLEGRRPRAAGCNARLGEHGSTIRVPIARISLDDGSWGFGPCRADRGAMERIAGAPLGRLFTDDAGSTDEGLAFDFPLWDLMARRAGEPVRRLAARMNGRGNVEPLPVPCYDTSLYFDDLGCPDDESAAELLAREACDGLARGHRAIKMKVGRGARHMPLEEGMRRDIAAIRAVREAIGDDAILLLDANNGYNLNLAKLVLAETPGCRIHWLEEPFHEDPVLYADLKRWLAEEELPILIADGEGDASPHLLSWARDHLIDVIQYDLFGYGFTRWLRLGRQLDEWKVQSAPHHYGGFFGNFAGAHLAAAIDRFTFVEWDEATVDGLDASHYRIDAGRIHCPDRPGFGIDLDEEGFRRSVESGGMRVES